MFRTLLRLCRRGKKNTGPLSSARLFYAYVKERRDKPTFDIVESLLCFVHDDTPRATLTDLVEATKEMLQ